MFKTRTTMKTKTQINSASQGLLPCPTHPSMNISHVCLSPNCSQSVSLCSECLFDSQQQQHLARHKEHIIQWNDLMAICRRQSVTGRLGDEPQKELNQIVLQTQAQQQHFKQYMKQQEQLINTDFDQLVTKFTEMISKLKIEFLTPYKVYLQDLQDMGTVLEKLVSDYYVDKTQDYNNDYDNFLTEIANLADQKNKIQQFNLRKLMQNIIPLVAKANTQFQRALSTQDDNQSQVSGLSLFSSFTVKQSDNVVLNDLVSEYKQLLQMRPIYKNQGLALQTYNQLADSIDKAFHTLDQAQFINPSYKSQLFKNNAQNKENGKLSSPKNKTKLIETVIKDQNTKHMSKLNKLEEDPDELKELEQKQQLRHQSQVQICESINQVSHVKGVKTTHKNGINCMVQIDEDFIATGSNDRSVKVYRYRIYELFKEINFKTDVTTLSVLVRKDGSSFLLVGLFKDIVILNQAFEVYKTFEKIHPGQINSIITLNDSQTLFSCAQNDSKLTQLNIQTEVNKKYFEHRDTITVLLMLQEQYVASSGKDRNIKIYKVGLNNGQFEKLQLSLSINEAHQTEVTSLACGGAQYLLSSCSSGELKLWDYMDGSPLRTIKNYAGWCFKIIYFAPEDQNVQQQQFVTQQTLIGSPRRARQPAVQDPFKNGYVATFSFDGTMKLFTGKSLLSENPTATSLQLKSLHECHPFGGIIAIKDNLTERLELLTSGNKNDNMIQVYNIK